MKKSVLATVTAALMLQGCIDNNSQEPGTFNLSITDAPIDEAAEVVIQVRAVEIKGDSDTIEFAFDEPLSINLLDLQGSNSAPLVADAEVPPGDYQWVRLYLDTDGQMDTYITLNNGESHELTVPSADQTGLKLVQGFTVPTNGSADFTLDFDLRKSIHSTGSDLSPMGQYLMRPTIRMVNNVEVGHINGTIDTSLICTGSENIAVYAFEGADAVVDDEGSANPPLTTALVSDALEYEIGFLTEGEYTLALNCMANQDSPEVDDQDFGNDLNEGFDSIVNVSVTANQTVTQDFN